MIGFKNPNQKKIRSGTSEDFFIFFKRAQLITD